MKGPGQTENASYGCKVDNKYEAIADDMDPFEALEAAQSRPKTADKAKAKAGDKPAAASAKKPQEKAAEAKKPEGAAPKSATTNKENKDAGVKKQDKPAQDKPPRTADKAGSAPQGQQQQRRAPQQARPQQHVIGMTQAADAGASSAGGQDGDAQGGDAGGFQQQRFSSARGRRGGPYGPGSAGPGPRGPPYGGPRRGGFAPRGGPRPFSGPTGPAPAGGVQGEDAAAAGAGTALNETGEEERLERNFDRPSTGGFGGGYRGGYGGRGRGGRGGYGRGRGGYFEHGTGRKREFERHSGSDVTGVKPVDKREGGGAHNWGTARDDLAGQTEPLAEGETGEEKKELKEARAGEAWTDLVNQDEAKAGGAATEDAGLTEPTKTEADEAHVYTLDDWKAKADKDRLRAEFNVRKANEGVDQQKWTGYVLKKAEEGVEEPEEDLEPGEEDDAEGGDEAKRKAARRLNIDIKFADPRRMGGRGNAGPRRGPPGPRGPPGAGPGAGPREESSGGFEQRDRPPRSAGYGGGRGGDRDGAGGSGYRTRQFQPSGSQAAPRLDNNEEFPSLGKQTA